MRYLFILLFLSGCMKYSVEDIAVCTKKESKYACIKRGDGKQFLAICDSELECRKVCNRARSK